MAGVLYQISTLPLYSPAISVYRLNMPEPNFSNRTVWVGDNLHVMRGGTDHVENLQLLCTHCNKSKGNKTMAEWRARQA